MSCLSARYSANKIKKCACGHLFHKKCHRQPPKCYTYTFPTATTQLVPPYKEVVTVRDLSLSCAQPTIEGNNTVATGVTDDNNTPSPIAQAQSQPVGQPQPTSCKPVAKLSASQQKWERYKTSINKGQRQKYGYNPSIRQRIRQAYSLDPCPIKARKREKHYLDPFPIKARNRKYYRCNPSPVRERGRVTYRLNPFLNRIRSTVAYLNDREGIKYKRRETYKIHRQNLTDKRSLDKLLACAISKKYKKLPDSFKNIPLREYY